MNYKQLIALPLVFALPWMASASPPEPPDPRPDYMPSSPPAEKAISAYTPGDALGAVITTNEHFPPGHPYRQGNFEEGLRANWPGAKVASNIDLMIEFILAAPPADPSPFGPKSRVLKRTYQNVLSAIYRVMDIPDCEKADALVRVVNAQTEPQKLKHAKALADHMFEALLDPRLLAYRMEGLDDPATYRLSNEEGTVVPIRWNVKRSILMALRDTLNLELDASPFWTSDEAANCAALKTWLTANWTAISNKCDEIKANPDRKEPPVSHQPWDARW